MSAKLDAVTGHHGLHFLARVFRQPIPIEYFPPRAPLPEDAVRNELIKINGRRKHLGQVPQLLDCWWYRGAVATRIATAHRFPIIII
ncbi:hypothetical protein J0H58_13030 [bacterium]|nr:hypothetical protein [bacterium]